MFLDPQNPHEPERAKAQLEGLLARLAALGPAPRRVLDLGCGAGRLLVPLAEAGHAVVGLDHDPAMLEQARAACPPEAAGRVTLFEADLVDPWPAEVTGGPPPDLVLLMGNTLMEFPDVDVAAGLLARIGECLGSAGVLLVDDVPADLWPELTEGHWLSGMSEDESMQLVWAPDDAVFVLREGEAVTPDDWTIRPGEPAVRLWTMGAIRLLARVAGLSVEADPGGGVLAFRRRG